MLGLNLNTNMPFSPVSEVTCQATTPDEEVDAVTGKMDKWLSELIASGIDFGISKGNEK